MDEQDDDATLLNRWRDGDTVALEGFTHLGTVTQNDVSMHIHSFGNGGPFETD